MGLITLTDITKKYNTKEVLCGLSLSINKGEVYGLVGVNGAGKTTLLNIMAGLLCPDSGSCLFEAEPVGDTFLELGSIGYLPDIPSFYDYLTVKEYISFLRAGGVERTRSSIVDSLLEDFDSSTKIGTLSRGNRQKLGIIASVMGNPKLLLLDEPTSALDPIGRRDVFLLLDQLRDIGISSVLSTHILSDMERVCNRIGFLHKGVIAKEISIGDHRNTVPYYEVVFSESIDRVTADSLSSNLEGFEISIDDNTAIIKGIESDRQVCKNDIYLALSKCDLEIIRVEKGKRCDLGLMMQEVLKE